MSRRQYLPQGRRSHVGHLEKFIEQSEAAGLACASCAAPLKITGGRWRLNAGSWEHKCHPSIDATWHFAVPRRLFETGLLRPMTEAELEESCPA